MFPYHGDHRRCHMFSSAVPDIGAETEWLGRYICNTLALVDRGVGALGVHEGLSSRVTFCHVPK